MTTLNETALLRAIADDPRDYISMTVLSDLLKEQGRDVEAEAWSFFVEKKRHPNKDNGDEPDTENPQHDELIYWWVREYMPDGNLPRVWMESIRDETTNGKYYAYNRRFSSPINTYLAAVTAYAKLTPKQRKEYWK